LTFITDQFQECFEKLTFRFIKDICSHNLSNWSDSHNYVQSHFRVWWSCVFFNKFIQNWNNFWLSAIFTNFGGDFLKGYSGCSFVLEISIDVWILKGWEKQVLYFFIWDTTQTSWNVLACSQFDLRFSILQKECESLNQISICDFTSERFGK